MAFYDLAKPLIFTLPPETAHRMTLRLMKMGMAPQPRAFEDPVLETSLWGLDFKNPIGLAAGFDKDAEVIAPVLRCGFGFVELGSVTPRPQRGNDKPRIFRDAGNAAVINRMGFPSRGLDYFKANLERFRAQDNPPPGIVGVNAGKNKLTEQAEEDYCRVIGALAPLADYLVVNVSSPNTPGLRDLQEGGALGALLAHVVETRDSAVKSVKKPPVLVKLAPDLDREQLGEAVSTVLAAGIDGLVISNTTLARPDALDAKFAAEQGGLSGRPLKDKATQMIHEAFTLSEGKLPIIGVGGVESGADAYAKIRAGASLVQLYSALVFKGPALVSDIKRDLAGHLKRDGFARLADAVGADHVTGKAKKAGAGAR